ncbi:MAG TPA: adenylate/guanylate cyclase domain-containing protein, partial [Thermoanaerobaculia bacterium]|nr:adenylate/guanylate cyclase domain-containing protein [Thermoanaerobaculia bacterium]
MNPPTGIVTLMFTDIVGSTALRDGLVAANGDVDGNALYRKNVGDPHNARIRGLLEEHNGFEVKTNGDSFMVTFAQPSDAVLCAVAIQKSLRANPIRTDSGPLKVRIGIHTGVAALLTRDGKTDYDGHAVNIAARIESLLKEGDRVYCSRTTADLAAHLPRIRCESFGPYTLKGVSDPVEVFEVVWEDVPQAQAPAQERLLYPWLTPWVGREREMAVLEAALRENRLVTLHGMGGLGKTRLAVETLLASSGGLPREIVFVPLEAARDSPEGLLEAMRFALGLSELEAFDVDSLCWHLRASDRVLLLDNFESVMNAAAILPRIALTEGIRILVTCQLPLGVGGEKVIDLFPLQTDESRRLFVQLAQQRDATWQPNDEDAMRDVLAALDGLPYLIE